MLAACAPSPVQVGQHPYVFALDDQTINYLLYLPEEYGRNRNQAWPLLIFLHGSGEQGSTVEELSLLGQHGPPKVLSAETLLDALASRFIVLSPQCDGWYWSAEFGVLDALLAEIQATYAVDPQRIYLTGVSMGGFGVWQYATRHPDWFAALAPFAGGYGYQIDLVYRGSGYSDIELTIDPDPPETMCDLKDVPVWVSHGAMDVGIPASQTADVLVASLNACGGIVRYTRVPEGGHDVWTDVYEDAALYDWLLAQHRETS